MGGARAQSRSTPLTMRSKSLATASLRWRSWKIAHGMTDIIVSIGGGGLIAGIISAIKAAKPAVRVSGASNRSWRRRCICLWPRASSLTLRPASLTKTLGAPFVSQYRIRFMPRASGRSDSGQRSGPDRGAAVLYPLTKASRRNWRRPAPWRRPTKSRTACRPTTISCLLICGCNDSPDDMWRATPNC